MDHRGWSPERGGGGRGEVVKVTFPKKFLNSTPLKWHFRHFEVKSVCYNVSFF